MQKSCKKPQGAERICIHAQPRGLLSAKLIAQNIDTLGYRNAVYSFLDLLDAMIFDEEQAQKKTSKVLSALTVREQF